MTQLNNISQHIIRTALCLALLLCTALGVEAQTVWDGTSKSSSLTTKDGSTTKAGTADNPYLITSGNDLKKLQSDTKLWDKCFLQTVDIDLGGNALGMIGKKGTPFKGTYDGGGNAIKNLKVDWSKINENDLMSFGLFGHLKGTAASPATVLNLQIENAVMTRTSNTMDKEIDGLRIGVLAGTVSPTTIIKNIAIIGSKIEDGGFGPTVKAAFVGGVIGSIASDFTTIYAFTAGIGDVTIHDISANVDFDLRNTTPSDTKQLNIGGIVGRMRRVKHSDIPLYTFYTGTVNAPWATVGPVFGSSRSGTNTGNSDDAPGDLYNAYTGEVITYAAAISTDQKLDSKDVVYLDTYFYYNGETINPDKNRFFSNYHVNDENITGTYPTYNSKGRKARTVGKDETLATANIGNMRSYQGVNRGTYEDMSVARDRQKVLAALNTESDSNVKFVWKNGHVELQNEVGVSSLERKTMHKFQANLLNLTLTKPYTYKWTISDSEGHGRTVSIASSGGTPTGDTDVLTIIDADYFKSTCAIIGEFHPYNLMVFEVYDGTELVASQSYDMGEVKTSIVRETCTSTHKETVTDGEGNETEIDVVTKNHFLFKADVELEGHHILDEPEFFEGVTCQWFVNDGATLLAPGNEYYAEDNPPAEDNKTYEIHIESTFVGSLRLEAFSVNPYDPSRTPVCMSRSMVNGVEVNYIEQENTGLQLSLTMEEYCGELDGVIQTTDFDPAHYHVDPSKKAQGFYYEVYDDTKANYQFKSGLITGITTDTKVKPFIFKVKVVDQMGNDWTAKEDALSHYRIQWNYRISGEGYYNETKKVWQKSSNFNEEHSAADGNYDEVNGWYDKDADDYGLLANIADKKATDYNGRDGYFKLIGDSIFIIHPNLLHRTSAFWVRVRLFDIEHDLDGEHPIETVLSFNQLAINLKKNTTDNTIDGNVYWRQWEKDSVYVSSTSTCTLIWYESTNPTDPSSWTVVQDTTGVKSRFTQLNPAIYNPERFYKLYYKSGFDLEAEEIIGPKNVVYVYDRAQTIAHLDRTDFNPYDQVTNQYYPTGFITNHGHDPHNAVRTMEQAYKILDADGTQDDNIIVVMGYIEDADYLLMIPEDETTICRAPNPKYKRNATITGEYGNIKGSTLWLSGESDEVKPDKKLMFRGVNGATIFKDITLYGGANKLILYANLNDLKFDTGVKMSGYLTLEANKNGIGEYQATDVTIVAGPHDYNKTAALVYPASNVTPGMTTMTFLSGSYARIIAGTRNNRQNQTSYNVFASPDAPHRVKVFVNIEDEQTWNTYPYDIGLLVGGQTDGTIYADAEIEMKAGSVGRFISGNISYGRAAYQNSRPSDSFFGSTTLNFRGGEIKELFGGTLGRHEVKNSTAASNCNAYFYGRSIINVDGGTINENVYGAGAGGVMGLHYHDADGKRLMVGTDCPHTTDSKIPYYSYNASDKTVGTALNYGSYEQLYDPDTGVQIGKMPVMRVFQRDAEGEIMKDSDGIALYEDLDFADSYVEINIKSGVVDGFVYGGGFGYSKQIPVERVLDQAGYIFGNCLVNINGGSINGNVYGGGAGSGQYVKEKQEYNAKPENADKQITTDFTKLAQVYGNATVNITGGTVTGSVYGGGQGILSFEKMAKLTGNTYVNISGGDLTGSAEQKSGGNVYGGASLGEIEGSTNVKLTGGYIGANVFGGSEGNADYPTTATVYGKTNVTLGTKNDDGTYSGTAIVNASIYGGCNVSSIRKPAGAAAGYGKGADITKNTDEGEFEAMTKVILNSGTIGNNIYGGSRGNDAVAGAVTDIIGDTYVRINGGKYINFYFLSDKLGNPVTGSDGKKRYRDFNVFGGGEKKCTINGTSHLDVRSGLMDIPGMATLEFFEDDAVQEREENKVDDSDINIFIPHEENPNSLEKNNTSKFQGSYMDLTYRRFSLYGGGYGEHTNSLNTDVYVYIPTNKRKPHGRTLKVPYDHQSFFDIAGGGYSGDIGYWVKEDNTRVVPDAPAKDYHHYHEGRCKVTIDGFTYCRKIIGGGFYGSCKTTETKVFCGSLRQIYGGSLLGYVHDKAFLEIGNRPDDLDDYTDPAVDGMTNEQKAKWLNDYIYFTENVYGGNDVKGIIGTKKWEWSDGAGTYYGQEGADGGPLWQADIDKEETKGVVMNIFGGKFMGDVFGAGNGHYRGYYVPGWIRYDDGPDRMYRMVRGINGMTFAADSIANWATEADKVKARHRVYRTRPMVGSVNINITGNSQDDMVKFEGNFYGGGSECSIGQWNTILPMEDPRRLAVGGHLHINIGGNVNFAKNLYMGNYGELYGKQQYLPAGINLSTYDGSTTTSLETIGEAAYEHWYFNTANNRYEPGFPAPGEADGNFGLLGEHMFRGYFKNIEMEGDVELTFYKNLYTNPSDPTTRKRWVPGEQAVTAYDAENITMNSFFLGGKCGYMTNNTYNVYCYNDNVGKHLRDVEAETVAGHVHEQWGSVYRITMPHGVTIKDKLVMGVEDAVTKFYPYKADFTAYAESELPEPMYTFEGGLITQTPYSFDHVVYNDMMTSENDGVWNPTITLPSDFYQTTSKSYNGIKTMDDYTLQYGIYKGKKIYRRTYTDYRTKNYMLRPNGSSGYTLEDNTQRRYGLAVAHQDFDDSKPMVPFFGRRASRTVSDDHQTVTKLTARCEFAPQEGTKVSDEDIDDNIKGTEMETYAKLYGGIIYGGCYNSGVIIGDVILNVASNMLGQHVTPENHSQWFDHISGLGHYIGRVYGGGYGKDARNDGDTYINLLRNVQAMNVFGGGMQGSVNGDTYINYVGTDQSYIYGAIYGGGFQGTIGKYYWRNNDYREEGKETQLLSLAEFNKLDDPDKEDKYHIYVETHGTDIILISGNVDHVYGGSCMGNVYGATDVELYDEVTGSLPHLDFSKYKDAFPDTEAWGTSRLIVGTVFGGNDISGQIYHTQDPNPETGATVPYDTNVRMREVPQIEDEEEEEEEEEAEEEEEEEEEASGGEGSSVRRKNKVAPAYAAAGKDTPGSDNGYNGFPLVGNLYGGSNGDYGEQVKPTGIDYYVYKDGSKIKFASGNENEIISINIGAANDVFPAALPIPNIDRANIEIRGGTVVNLYGGGDMSTITEKTNITVAYETGTNTDSDGNTIPKNMDARAGFSSQEDFDRIWNTCHLESDQQINEVTTTTKTGDSWQRVFTHQIYRIFGGNDHADMDIQPQWNLTSGHVGSVYSGANFGRMTYYNPDANPASTDEYKKYKGLLLPISSRQFHAKAVYGGGRVGDIYATYNADVKDGEDIVHAKGTLVDLGSTEYGATLHIVDGVIDNVYGGNDVSGVVNNGTHVIIEGAISGDVYCAGNGNYRYLYDAGGSMITDASTKIVERYSDDYGGRYFILAKKLKPDNVNYYGSSGIDKLEAINSYRPNVSKTRMTINGRTDNIVYVRGNVYCGGNSAAVSAETTGGKLNDIKFEIGDHVRLNSVFLGSNGESLMTNEMIAVTEKLNDIDLSASSGLTGDKGLLYPNLLDVYMQAVESKGVPSGFRLDEDAEDAYIGDFFLGGNRGSMMTDRTIELEFPEKLVIYGRIVGGSQTANFEYTGKTKKVKHIGGLNKKLDTVHNLKGSVFNPNKVELTIKSKFEPWYMEYPKNGDLFDIQLKADVNRKYGDPSFSRWRCNIYGGCFNSGRIVGDISIDLYSDLVGDYAATSDIGKALADSGMVSKKDWIINGINREGDDQHRTFSLIGGGYGEDTDVYGNIRLRMLPSGGGKHPSAATVFGGSQDGRVVGNTLVELRDGTVFTNLYGASEATPLYGSSQIIIGWPEYYKAAENGTYTIDKVDQLSDYHDKLKNTVSFREGDIVSKRVYDAITAADKASKFTLVNTEAPSNWNDIAIHVGDNASLEDNTAKYYGHGNVYGGGYISQKSATGELGAYTVRKFPAATSPEAEKLATTYTYEGYSKTAWAGLGGNSMILVWDNADTEETQDHISIGTGHFVPVTLNTKQDVLNYYKQEGGHFVQQSSKKYVSGQYYEIESDGGIYGDGRMVYVEGMRVCDLAYYGYAGSCPQYPKMLNTFQRLDLLSVTDCCLRLEGAQDIVTNGMSNPTMYSITRVGELKMFSTINSNNNLNGGTRDASDLNKVVHSTSRTRNYMAFGHGALYLGAIKSDIDFATAKFHEPDGTVNTQTYKEFKNKRIDDYMTIVGSSYVKDLETQTAFEQRNMGTAANMIGINNGYSLHIQGLYEDTEHKTSTKYAGPAVGVFEVKLLTLSRDEGGGYIYALNKHEKKTGDARYHFLETPGNFVYAGAAYKTTTPSTPSTPSKRAIGSYSGINFIYDDCVPMGHFETMTNPNTEAKDKEHVWYVNGSTFFFNASLTGYTSADHNVPFILDNISRDVYLYGIEEGQTITVEEVTWTPSQNTETDIQDYRSSDSHAGKDYKLYVSVGDTKDDPHHAAHASDFVAKVSRSDYDGASSPADKDVDYAASPDSTYLSIYQNHSDTVENQPYLGITLIDNVDNTARNYFNKHLAKPEKVRVTLRAEGTDRSGNTILSHYNIDLDIYYLLSPIITGNIVIENGALPGEYIFANAFDVNIEKDDNILISGYDWYIAPKGLGHYKSDDGVLVSANVTNAITSGEIVKISDNWKFSATDNTQIHIPAARYMNNWGLIYAISVDQNKFYRIPATHPDSLGKIPGKPYKPCLEVHNYNRMLPTAFDRSLSSPVEDLKLTAGANIYIEDDIDMAYFYQWLATCQGTPTRWTEEGKYINPKYGDSLTVYLMADVTLPASANTALKFKGTFHGGGHTIDMNGNDRFLTDNDGTFYNTGFIFNKANTAVKAFGENNGTIHNCFYYNKQGGAGTLFLNSPDTVPDGLAVGKAIFDYGKAAYDLNGFYLAKRDDIRNSVTGGPIAKIIDDIYEDGEYRYALVSADGLDPKALRKYNSDDLSRNSTPNYLSKRNRVRLDQLAVNYGTEGSVTGFDMTMHNDLDPMPAVAPPSFPDDYLFFGQTLGTNAHPLLVTAANRVYRAGGFYGSKYDKAFHFNRDAKALQPTLTAINFNEDNTVATLPDTVPYPDYIYYPPTADMPADGLNSFQIDNSAGITHNLLVYDDGHVPFSHESIKPDHVKSDEANINVHVLDKDCKTAQFHLVDKHDFNAPIDFTVTQRAWYNRLPTHFSSGNSAWEGICLPFTPTQVSGSDYCNDPSDTDYFYYDIRNHGQLSHFYGYERSDTLGENIRHEYWLRSLTGWHTEENGTKTVLDFTRPLYADKNGALPYRHGDGANDTVPLNKATYHYSNTWFATAYNQIGTYEGKLFLSYQSGHTAQQYTKEGRDFHDYPFLTDAVPYIISFPGRRFYEFDMSGEFYNEHHNSINGNYPQMVTYDYTVGNPTITGNAAMTGTLTIPISDDNAPYTVHGTDGSSNSYKITGTYMHRSLDENQFTVDVSGSAGTSFSHAALVEPFRVYVTAPAGASPVRAYIGTRAGATYDALPHEEEDKPEEELCPLRVYVTDGALHIESPTECTAPLYGISGTLFSNLTVHKGHNVYRGLNSGVYIVFRKKFAIKR